MFSKHTFGARSYGHYQGYREKGDTGPAVTNAWRAAQKAKRLRAESFRATRGAAKSQRRFAKISSGAHSRDPLAIAPYALDALHLHRSNTLCWDKPAIMSEPPA